MITGKLRTLVQLRRALITDFDVVLSKRAPVLVNGTCNVRISLLWVQVNDYSHVSVLVFTLAPKRFANL